ncbi:Senecionine N-oxygenase [Vermiconidia calcicola]|uniref:Senecionine N-oxygenase n=1 Tax=Vermiconidia calcicola TaxID=1690605 RepID=A0ACC3N9G5_9PEZI|nr:Senecionine N-oxygenase [Vermiconidia calcicola]
MTSNSTITIGVLALQGAFAEHIKLLQHAATELLCNSNDRAAVPSPGFEFIEVRNPGHLHQCHALIIPGGESTSISLIASRTGLLEPLRDFVKVQRRPVWGTCAGLILLAEEANRSKDTGQDLIGGLDVRVQRNYFGRQVESFEAELELPFLGGEGGTGAFHSVFIRAPVVEKILPSTSTVQEPEGSVDGTVTAPPRKGTSAEVKILGRLPGRARALKDRTTTAAELGEDGDIVAVKQGNVFGTAFHPELTGDARIHAWWLGEVLKAAANAETK